MYSYTIYYFYRDLLYSSTIVIFLFVCFSYFFLSWPFLFTYYLLYFLLFTIYFFIYYLLFSTIYYLYRDIFHSSTIVSFCVHLPQVHTSVTLFIVVGKGWLFRLLFFSALCCTHPPRRSTSATPFINLILATPSQYPALQHTPLLLSSLPHLPYSFFFKFLLLSV